LLGYYWLRDVEGRRQEKIVTKEEVLIGAQNILNKRAGEPSFRVFVDSPKDCDQTLAAFKKLGCKVKTEQDGRIIVVTRQAS